MTVKLEITSQLQKYFEECIPKQNYGGLRDCWKDVLAVVKVVKDVKGLDFLFLDQAQFMAENMEHFLEYLISYDKNRYNHWEMIKESEQNWRCREKMYADIGRAISNKNWKQFFKKYSISLDCIIRQTRNQKLIDFSIEHNGKWYKTLASWYSAKNTAPLKLDLTPVRVTIGGEDYGRSMIITEHMMRSFKECALNQDYTPFYEENQTFITELSEKLKNHFRYCDESSRYIKFLARNVKSSFVYLTRLKAQNSKAVTARGYGICTLKQAFLNKDWSEFYQSYRWDFMHIIRVAREQKLFELMVETGGGKVMKFEDWDKIGHASSSITDDPPDPTKTMRNSIFQLPPHSLDYSPIRSTCWCHKGKALYPSPHKQIGTPKAVFKESKFQPMTELSASQQIALTLYQHTQYLCETDLRDDKREDSDGLTEIPNDSQIGPIEAERTTQVLDTSKPSKDEVSPSAAPIKEEHVIDDSLDSCDDTESLLSMVKRQLEMTKLENVVTVIEEELEDVDDYHQSEEIINLKKQLDNVAKLRDTLRQVEEDSEFNNTAYRYRTPSEDVTSSVDRSEFEERLRVMKEQFAKELHEKKEERRRTMLEMEEELF